MTPELGNDEHSSYPPLPPPNLQTQLWNYITGPNANETMWFQFFTPWFFNPDNYNRWKPMLYAEFTDEELTDWQRAAGLTKYLKPRLSTANLKLTESVFTDHLKGLEISGQWQQWLADEIKTGDCKDVAEQVGLSLFSIFAFRVLACEISARLTLCTSHMTGPNRL